MNILYATGITDGTLHIEDVSGAIGNILLNEFPRKFIENLFRLSLFQNKFSSKFFTGEPQQHYDKATNTS